MSYIFLDTETHAKENPILIQLAYIRYENWVEVIHNALYSTGGPKIEFWAMAVHHITEKMIEWRETFTESVDKNILLGRLLIHDVIVAHNAKFDVWVLKNHNLDPELYICTLKLARYVYPEMEAHNLQFLRYALGLEFDREINPHDALSDVYVLIKLFYHLMAALINKDGLHGEDASDEMDKITKRMIEITRSPSLLYKCVFGKNAGKLWSEIPKDYLSWIVNQDFDEDVKYTASYYLSNNTQLKI